jgi:maltooligosyltrehalose trehalohydrolase
MDVLSFEKDYVLAVRRWNETNEVLAIFNFNERPVQQFENVPRGAWTKRLDSSDSRWLGSGTTALETIQSPMQLDLTLQPYAVLLYEKEIQD